MTAIIDLRILLKDMKPVLKNEDYVFCVTDQLLDTKILNLKPICMVQEEEGLTLILRKKIADKHNLKYEGIFSQITLTVHSSLEAVGLTAAFSKALADYNISANVIAGYYHDHIFVPKDKKEKAMEALIGLTE